jgi:hypothetical protein
VPRFFVPLCDAPDQAADVYSSLVDLAAHPLAASASRLFRVVFHHDDRIVTAEVGANLEGWHDPIGPVLAIIETTRILYIHVLPSPRAPASYPLLVSPEQVMERAYFDDYRPPRSP